MDDLDAAASSDLEAAAASLQERGYATLPVLPRVQALHRDGFAAARAGLAVLASAPDGHPAMIVPGADSAHLTGMHRAGALSSYNACREGFVFSDGGTIALPEAAGFAPAMATFFASALAVAHAVLAEIERRLQIPSGWFEANFGPLGDNAQWHCKRYVAAGASPHAVTADAKRVLLAVHSDPSIISVVLHDRPGTNAGALGLECMRRGGGWDEVGGHGHGVATVLCGSVLQKVTGGAYPAARHRVTMPDDATAAAALDRVAATFFFRPAPDAVLAPPPGMPSKAGSAVTFGAWTQRVASRYGRHAEPAPLGGEAGAQEGAEPDG